MIKVSRQREFKACPPLFSALDEVSPRDPPAGGYKKISSLKTQRGGLEKL
jgi:hypothetical protein